VSRRGECCCRGLGFALALGLATAGCAAEKLTEGDCVAIRERLQSAWDADANEAATLAETEELRRFVKDESARIGARWMTECRKLVGSETDRAEITCLRKVARIDDVARCQPAQ
jgi:hypothetical protein